MKNNLNKENLDSDYALSLDNENKDDYQDQE
jgi:hypothetical protein